MKIILIYSVLFTFFINEVVGHLDIFRGLSLFNLNIYLLLFAWAWKVAQTREIYESNNVNKYMILLIIVVLVSISVKMLRGEMPDLSIMHELILFKSWLNPMLLFFILYNIIDDEKTCNQILLGLYCLFLALILNQFAAIFGLTAYKAGYIAKTGRAGGFSAPGTYAITLVLFFPFVLSGARSLLYKRSNLFKIGCIVLVFLTLVAIVCAGSRNGVVSFFVSMLVYLMILKREKIMGFIPIIFLIITMIVIGVTAFAVTPSSVKEIVIERFVPGDSYATDINEYTSGRIGLYKSGLKFFAERPLLGHGQSFFSAHNEYLRYLVEYGIVGLVVYLLIFFKIFQNIWHSLKTTTSAWRKQLYISYIAGFLGYMTGLSATNAGPSIVIFWIYTTTILKYAQLDMDEKGISPGLNNSIT